MASCRGPEAEREAVDAVNREISRLVENGVGEEELKRCLNRLESSRTFDMLGLMNRVQALALAEYHGEDLSTSFERNYLPLTPEEIRRTAEEIFNPSRAMTLIYRPANG